MTDSTTFAASSSLSQTQGTSVIQGQKELHDQREQEGSQRRDHAARAQTLEAKAKEERVRCLQEQVRKESDMARDWIEDLPNQIAGRPKEIQRAIAWLEEKRRETIEGEKLNTTRGAHSSHKQLIPLDSAMAILLYADERYATQVAMKINDGLDRSEKLRAAELEGGILWNNLVKKIVNCPETPDMTPLPSDVDTDDDLPDTPLPAPAVVEDSSRAGQSRLANQLHLVHAGTDPVTGLTSGTWNPPLDYYEAWAKIRLHEPERMSATGLIACRILRYALKKDSPDIDLAWRLLSKFSGVELSNFRSQMNNTQNAWLTTPGIGKLFETYKIVLDPIIPAAELDPLKWSERTYECQVIVLDPLASSLRLPATITFTNHYKGTDTDTHRIPHPCLLYIHSLLGRVLQLKAMAEHVEEYLRECEDVDEVMTGEMNDVASMLEECDTRRRAVKV